MIESDDKALGNFNKRLLIGAVGCGRVFESYYLPVLMRSEDWNLIAVCEPLEERREWIKAMVHGLSVFEDLDKFLYQASLDAVLIATPPATHCHLAIRALEAGRHLLVEKPLALDVEEARSMIEASIRTQKKLWVSFNRRFRRPYRTLKEKLADLSVDNLRKIRFQLVLDPKGWNPITPYLGEESQGGGVLDDVASHQIDLLCWLIEQPIQAVKAKSIDTQKAGTKCFQYELKFENGLIGECIAGHGNFYYEYLEMEWSKGRCLAYPAGLVHYEYFPESWIRKYCSLRTLLHWITHKLVRTPNLTVQSFENQLLAFATAIRGEKGEQGANAEAGLRCIRVIQACQESATSGGGWISVI